MVTILATLHLHLGDLFMRSLIRLQQRPRLISQAFRVIVTFTLACGVMSCAEPPPAPPEDLEELLSYLFEHAGDEDPMALSQGIVELHAWFQDDDNLQAAREGFVITKLSQEALLSLNQVEDREQSRANDSLRGVHVVTKSPHCVRSVTGLLTWNNFGDLLDSFDSYERTFEEGDTSCMIDRSCLSVTAHSETSSRWVGLIGIKTRYQIEFRWVYTEVGWALVHRFWLKDPAIGDSYDVRMNANYYIGVTLPDVARTTAPPAPALLKSAGGVFGGADTQLNDLQETLQQPGALRIHANWFDVDTGVIPLSDDRLANLLVQNQKNDSQSHDEMIDLNEIPGECNMIEGSEDPSSPREIEKEEISPSSKPDDETTP